MNALRLASMYLRFLSSQFWATLVGILLMAVGLLGRDLAPLFLIGTVLLVLFPALFGGLAMRMVSSGKGLHLRPAGYRRMLLGAMLATLLLTAMQAGPVLAAVHFDWIRLPRGLPNLGTVAGATSYLLLAWSIIAATWLAMFCLASIHVLGLALIPVLMIVLPLLSRNRTIAAFLGQLSLPFATFPSLVAVGWMVFAAWYLRGRVLRSPTQSAAEFGQRFLVSRKSQDAVPNNDSSSRAVALRAYLLGTTSWRDLLLGFSIALVSMVPLAVITANRPNFRPLLSFVFAVMLVVIGPAMASSTMRRARFLWLKAGVDRPALFGIVERLTAQVTAIILLGFAIVLTLLTAFLQPDAVAVTLLFEAVFLALGISLTYGALCFVRPWKSVHTLLIPSGLGVLGPLVWKLLPSRSPDLSWFMAAMAGALVLAVGLRLVARRRWRQLDWQLMRPLVLATPDKGVHGA